MDTEKLFKMAARATASAQTGAKQRLMTISVQVHGSTPSPVQGMFKSQKARDTCLFCTKEEMNVWRVLIVEDDMLTREFFSGCVTRCAELKLMASLGTLGQALDWLDLHANEVDVLLTDLGLPDGSGLTAIRHATRLNPACEPLVISMFGDEDNVLASIEAGALGYIHKDSTPEDIAQTILDMCAGASPISPMIARRVLAKYRSQQYEATNAPQSLDMIAIEAINHEVSEKPSVSTSRALLSRREHEILTMIARGFNFPEIARLQGLSLHTVQSHVKNLYGKLSVHSKNEAVFEATRMGLLGKP